MKQALLGAACALALVACSNAATPAPGAAPSAAAESVARSPASSNAGPAVDTTLAHYDGYGDMRFGMDEAAFGHAWNGVLVATKPAEGSSCFYQRPKWVKAPRDFSFMFEGGHFVRYDIGTAKEAAPGGGKVGMTSAQIHALYAQVEEQPHKYIEGAHYLRVHAAESGAVLVFETDASGKVTRWRVGVPPQIDYVEGCG